MTSTKKLTVYRKRQFSGPRRRKPAVRRLNQGVKSTIQKEHDLIQKLIRDADTRRALWGGIQHRLAPFTVWNDCDRSRDYTELRPQDLPAWKHIGQYLKIHLLFQVALEYGGYAFTVRVRPDLEEKWRKEGRDPMDRINRMVRKEIERQGLTELEYCYVVEGRSRHGRNRTPLHLHGFFLAEDPMIATRFKVAMEESIACPPSAPMAQI